MQKRKHSKTFYFFISQGLRGCYMPDNSYVTSAQTRKELKFCLENEAYYIRDAGFVGCSKRAIAWLANTCWQNRNKITLDFVAPYRNRNQLRNEYPYGLFCSPASKQDYLESQESN